MTTKIEMMDRKRKAFRRGYISAMLVFVLAWIARAVIKNLAIKNDLLETLILIILLLCVLIQAFFVLKEGLLGRQINRDPLLKQAMNDELVKLNELKAWKTSFFALMGYNIIVAVLSLFVTFNDLMVIFLTAMLIGFGSYHISNYLLNR